MENTIELTAEQANQLRIEANEKVKLAQAMDRLHDNPDFKLLYETYTEKEAVRLVSLLADPAINMGDKREAYIKDIEGCLTGIARFNYYCTRTIYQLAQQATKVLEDLEKASVN